MASMPLTIMNVTVISEDIIKPSHPTPNQLRSLPTSLFDQVNSPVFIPLVFFFNFNNTITKYSTNEVLDRLKGSFAKTLSMFYPLAGRVKDANHIDCNDEGVPYVEAEVDKPLRDVVHKAEVSQLDKLFPPYGQQVYSRLLLTIQVNVFTGGGLAIGMMMSHVIADGFSMFMFLKTWASIANGKDSHTLLPQPYFDIWKLFPSPSPQTYDMDMQDDLNPNLKPDKHVTKWFMFSEEKLNSLRSKLLSYINTMNENNILCDYTIGPPSLPMVLSAFIWSRIMVACHNNNVNIIPCEVLHAVNIRFVVNPPDMNSYYFGNMYTSAIAKPSFRFIEDNNNNNNNSYNVHLWYEFLQQSEKSIKKIISKDESFLRGIEEGTEDLSFVKEHYLRKSKGEIMSMDFSNVRSLPVYEADFGWGKPVWVAAGSQKFKDYVILIHANPTSNDIFAYVCLSDDDMARLESDAEFITLVSNAPSASSKL